MDLLLSGLLAGLLAVLGFGDYDEGHTKLSPDSGACAPYLPPPR